MKLIIGNKNYSSWSLRAWLYLVESGLTFDEIKLSLFTPGWREQLAKYTPAGRVPVLLDGDATVWDSLAIIGHLQETRGDLLDWPQPPAARAMARSICHEMHSGFLALRAELPQNLRARHRLQLAQLSSECQRQLARIEQIWVDARQRFAGDSPWLFGEFSVADVIFAPVALRLVTYSIGLAAPAQQFVAAVQTRPSVARWTEAAVAESEALPFIDGLKSADEAPLVLG